jgi:hypothetical protein
MAFEEPGSRDLMLRLSRFDSLFSSPLTEAEFRSALRRERRLGIVGNLLSWLTWVYPRRRLTPELEQILEIDSPRGADLWHLSCALFLRPRLQDLRFFTLDERQDQIARALNFPGL